MNGFKPRYGERIVEFLTGNKMGTPAGIVAALPDHLRIPNSIVGVHCALASLISKGVVARVGHGVYALAGREFTALDAATREDALAAAISDVLAYYRHQGVHKAKLYDLMGKRRLEWDKPAVQRKLLQLKRKGLVFKTPAQHWVLKIAATASTIFD